MFGGRFNKFVLSEVAMLIDYCPFVSFVGCLGSFVLVGMTGFVDYYNCDFMYSG